MTQCKKDKLTNIDCSHKSNDLHIVSSLIKGTWLWNSTQTRPNTAPPTIITITPASEGYNQKLIFSNGKVSKYKNDSLIFENSYDVTYLNTISGYQSDSSVIIVFNDINTGQRNWFSTANICTDTVIFYNPFYDVMESWNKLK